MKRLAASFVLACRNNGFSRPTPAMPRGPVSAATGSAWPEFSEMPALEVWYASIDVETLIADDQGQEAGRRAAKRLAAARARSVLEHDFPKLATGVGHEPTIKDNPP